MASACTAPQVLVNPNLKRGLQGVVIRALVPGAQRLLSSEPAASWEPRVGETLRWSIAALPAEKTPRRFAATLRGPAPGAPPPPPPPLNVEFLCEGFALTSA